MYLFSHEEQGNMKQPCKMGSSFSFSKIVTSYLHHYPHVGLPLPRLTFAGKYLNQSTIYKASNLRPKLTDTTNQSKRGVTF